MKKNSLASNGLSLSQAQSISNLCNQRASEISNKLSAVNNYSKKVTVDGVEHETVKGRMLPEDVVALLKEKAELHACQAFLMENIKGKDAMLKKIQKSSPDFSSVKPPVPPKYVNAELLSVVDESWGEEQLTVSEVNELLEAEAFASHIGQFIHKGSVLDTLRNELPGLPDIEWMTIKGDGTKSPVKLTVHHTPEYLLKVHEELATLHRGYEQRVNYFKAKIKNLTTAENARIANVNADAEAQAEKTNNDIRAQYDLDMKKYNAEVLRIKTEYEKERQDKIKSTAALRIQVDPRFQKVVDIFLTQLPKSQE